MGLFRSLERQFQLRLGTTGLWYFTWRSAEASAKAVKLASAEFIASRRPKLRVRMVSIDRPVEGNLITVRYEVINVGDTVQWAVKYAPTHGHPVT